MDDSVISWLKLHISVPVTVKTCSLISAFGSAQAIYSSSACELIRTGFTDEVTAEKILSADEKKARDIAAVCEKYGWSVITPESEYYPMPLKRIKDFPFVLFCSGDLNILAKEPKFSVVGTRSPSEKGLMSAYLLAACLSSMGAVTVSGGAVGIDSAAHEGALLGNGGTIAVLGCGLGSDYLPENSFLRSRIEKNGLLVSELSPFTEPSRYTFPRRNRIISALSRAVVVTESGERGGSLITADYARKQKRRVFCFAEDIVKSPGCGLLIKNGAEVFSTPRGLVGEFPGAFGDIQPDEKYLDYELKNDGIDGVHIIKPSTMTADSFAAYNGITPENARRVLGKKLRQPTYKTIKVTVPPEKNKKIPEGILIEPVKIEQKTEEPKTPPQEKLPDYLSREALAVFAALDTEPQYFDEIQYKTSLSAQEIMTAVTELELEGLAVLAAGNRVSRV